MLSSYLKKVVIFLLTVCSCFMLYKPGYLNPFTPSNDQKGIYLYLMGSYPIMINMCDKKKLKDESRDFVQNQHQILRANVIRNVYQTLRTIEIDILATGV